MQVNVDGKVVVELSETQQKVICNDIPSEIFQEDMERRVEYILMHKYEKCYERLKKEWEEKLQGRVDSIPLDKDAFANLVFSQPDYQDRTAREG